MHSGDQNLLRSIVFKNIEMIRAHFPVGPIQSPFDPTVLTFLIKIYVTQKYVITSSLPENDRYPNLVTFPAIWTKKCSAILLR